MIKKIVLTTLIGVFTTLSFAADIYKYIDENGTTYYTDKKPKSGVSDEELKTITIIESNDLNPKSTWQRMDHKRKQQASNFEDFFIASPSDGSILTVTKGNTLVSVNLNKELSESYRIKFYIDGLPHGKVKSSTQLIGDLIEGQHTLYAEVINATSRQVIKTTPKIKFNLKFKK